MPLMLFAALSAALAAPQLAPAQLPNASPAIWIVQDSDTTIYLFGTFHALDGRSDWFNDEVYAAFSQADELVLETVLPKMHFRPVGSSGDSLTPSGNFLGATRMAVSAGRDRGLDASKGADIVLRRAADEAGKQVAGLETLEFQFDMLRRLETAGAAPRGGGRADPHARSRIGSVMSDMQASWNRGDQRIFATMLDRMRRSTPDTYRAMFPERNANWARWIAARMDQPGTVFVAVGAGHFAGPESVLAKLSSYGLAPTRMNQGAAAL